MVDCFKKITEELGITDKADKKTIEDTIVEFEKEIAEKSGADFGYGDLVEREAKDFAEAARFLARKKLGAYKSAIATFELVKKAPTDSKFAFTKFVADTVSYVSTAREETLAGIRSTFFKPLKEAGVLEFFKQQKDPEKVTMFMNELAMDGAIPRTLESLPEADRAAYKTAQIMNGAMKKIRELKNKAGLAVADLEGRITQQFHNPDLVAADRAGHKEFLLKAVDWSKPLADEKSILNKVYEGNVAAYIDDFQNRLISGDFSTLQSTDDFLLDSLVKDSLRGNLKSKGGGSLLSQASKSRSIDIKPEFYHEYATTYGYGDVYDQFHREISLTARSLSDTQTLGQNPQAILERALDSYKRRNPDLKAWVNDPKMQDKIVNLMGSNDVAVDTFLAKFGSSTRKFAAASQLGFVVATSFVSDIATGSLRRAFINAADSPLSGLYTFQDEFIKGFARMFEAYDDETARHIAKVAREELDVLMDDFTKHAAFGDHMDLTNPTLDGRLNHTPAYKAMNAIDHAHDQLRKLNLLETWTKGRQAKIAPSVAADFGGFANKNFASLSKAGKAFIEEAGLKDMWDVIRHKVVTNETSGLTYLPKNAADNLNADEVAKILGRKELTEFGLEQGRQKIALEFRARWAEEVKRRVMLPGTNTRSMLVGQSQRGTGYGELRRNFAQYKSFPLELWYRLISPMVHRASAGDIAIGTAFMGVTMAGFIMRNWLGDVVNGDTPRDYFSDDPDVAVRNWSGLVASSMGMPVLDRIIPRIAEGKPLSSYDFMALAGPVNQMAIQTGTNIALAPGKIASGKGDEVTRQAVQGVLGAPVIRPLLFGGVQKAFTAHAMEGLYSLLDKDYEKRKEKYAKEKGSERIEL